MRSVGDRAGEGEERCLVFYIVFHRILRNMIAQKQNFKTHAAGY